MTSIQVSDWSVMHPVAGHDVMMGSKVGGNARNGHEMRRTGSLGTSGALCDQPQVIVGLSPGVTTSGDLERELGSQLGLVFGEEGRRFVPPFVMTSLLQRAEERLQPNSRRQCQLWLAGLCYTNTGIYSNIHVLPFDS